MPCHAKKVWTSLNLTLLGSSLELLKLEFLLSSDCLYCTWLHIVVLPGLIEPEVIVLCSPFLCLAKIYIHIIPDVNFVIYF